MSTSSQIDFARYVVKTIQVAPSATGTPVAISPTPLWASFIRIRAFNGATRAANAGTVFVTDKSANDDTQGYPLAPSDTLDIYLPNDGIFDLSKVFIDVATANDGVVVMYAQPINSI